ncbi:Fic family protein [Geomonas sp. Red276]
MRPPLTQDILNAVVAAGPALLGKVIGLRMVTDAQGRYLHWDKVRYLEPPHGLTPEQYWLSFKLSRNYKQLPFIDKAGDHFRYVVIDSMLKDLHWLDQNASGSILMHQPITNPNTRDTYLVSSLMEEAINSSQIEGAATTREVAKEMLREGRPPRDYSEQMIYNNYLAMQFVRENRNENLTKEMIFELHRILTEETLQDPDKAGRLRAVNDRIHVVDAGGTEILHTPPKAEELESRLELLCTFANEREAQGFLHPLLKAMILHFMIGYDHPFVDGNGRTARALFYWYALRHGYWLLEFLSISAVIKEAPQQYVKAYLFTETDENDVTYFLIHQLETIRKAIERLHEYLRTKAGEIEEAEKLLERTVFQGKLNHRQLALLDHALKHPGALYTIEGHRNSHRISYQTARTDLLKLSEEVPLLRKRKQGNAFAFAAPLDLRKRLEELSHP